MKTNNFIIRYKEVSYRLENKVVELTQILDEEKNTSKQLSQKNENMQEEIQSLRQKLDHFKPFKDKYNALLAEKVFFFGILLSISTLL